MAGKWHTHFRREAPLVLELACGRGEYSLGLAELSPENNYIGVDIKGARIHQGAVLAAEQNLNQVAFLRTKIEYIDHFFAPEEIDTIWIIFPDPFLKSHKSNRRLTSPRFIDRYRKILNKNGTVKLKTDSPLLYEYTLEVIKNDPSIKIVNRIDDVHHVDHDLDELRIITYYEKMHIARGRKINYIEFTII
ncbi:UNVERIFIED_CONTAM: hypothetical protein GTU68_001949 [Idotea baltica]|nr:hypothetical protein [Idotea baltica]